MLTMVSLSRFKVAAILSTTWLAMACSGSPKAAEPERLWNTADEKTSSQPEGEETEAELSKEPISLQATCERFRSLRNEGCAWTARFPADLSVGNTCEISMAKWIDPSTPNHKSLERTLRCWSLDCDAAVPCMKRAQALRDPDKPRNCGDEGTAPILVDAATWQARRGATAKRFAELTTSPDEPIEVCGIEGEVEWMTRMTCNDGSNPYESREEVNDRRDSFLDRGGRCNSIVNRFTVPCPEASYKIYFDRYVCPANP